MTRSALVLLLAACSSQPTVTAPDDAVAQDPVAEPTPRALDWLPTSESTTPPTGIPAATIRIRADHIEINRVRTVDLVDGKVPDDERFGQMVTRAYERLLVVSEQTRERHARMPGTNVPPVSELLTCQILADRDTSFETLLQVLYTAGQAQFPEFELAVRGTAPESPVSVVAVELPSIGMPGEPVDERLHIKVLIDAHGYEVMSGLPWAWDARPHAPGLQILEVRGEAQAATDAAPATPAPVRVDCDPTPCTHADAYDATTLTPAVQGVRTDAHGPMVILTSDADTPYQALIHAADAALAGADASAPVQLVIVGGWR